MMRTSCKIGSDGGARKGTRVGQVRIYEDHQRVGDITEMQCYEESKNILEISSKPK